MLAKRSAYLIYVLWLIGLIILALISFHYEQVVKRTVSETFTMLPEFWFMAYMPFLFGIYFGLVFIKGKSYRANLPLLLSICLPCVLLTFYSPIVFTFVAMTSPSNSFTVPIPFWLTKLTNYGFVSVVAGTTLIVGLFGSDKNTPAYDVNA